MHSFHVRIALGHVTAGGRPIDAVELAELERLARVYLPRGGHAHRVAGWYESVPEGATVIEAVLPAANLSSALALARDLAGSGAQSAVAVTVTPAAFLLVGPAGDSGEDYRALETIVRETFGMVLPSLPPASAVRP